MCYFRQTSLKISVDAFPSNVSVTYMIMKRNVFKAGSTEIYLLHAATSKTTLYATGWHSNKAQSILAVQIFTKRCTAC